MHIKKLFIIIIYFVFLAMNTSVSAEEFTGLLVYSAMDQQHFFADEDPIIKVCIKNNNSRPVTFTIYSGSRATGDYFTFQPVVYDMQGVEAELIVPYRQKNQSLSDVVSALKVRTITLMPGETFSHAINLNVIYKLKKEHPYRVKSFFFPDLKEKIVLRSSNELIFKLVESPASSIISGVKRPRKRFSPAEIVTAGEVVMLHLDAEKKKDWPRFIKYIDISQYINSYSNYVRLYQLADDDEKAGIEENFISFLSRDRGDYLLDYEIIKEEVENNQKIAYVEVMVERFRARQNDRYTYRYTLEKENNFWLITGLEASILKGFTR